MDKYKVITLCGSTKFKKEFEIVERDLTLAGNIVISVGLFSHSDNTEDLLSDNTKKMLVDIHRKKIDMADEIYVIDVNGYIGENTYNEIQYATSKKIPINYYSKNYE